MKLDTYSLPTISLPDCPKSVDVNIDSTEVVKILFHFGKQMPVIFLYVKAEVAHRIRMVLGMENKSKNYYDPTSSGVLCF